MKSFFQGLFLGVIAMYIYLNQAELLAPYRGWFGSAAKTISPSPTRQNTDDDRQGFIFERESGTRAGERVVRS